MIFGYGTSGLLREFSDGGGFCRGSSYGREEMSRGELGYKPAMGKNENTIANTGSNQESREM